MLAVAHPAAQPTGIVLVVGSSLFLIGAALPPEPGRVFGAPLREHLAILERHASRWRVMNVLMIASIVGTAAGLALFAPILRGGGDLWRATAGAVVYAFVGVGWVVALAFRATATIHAARATKGSGSIPDWLEPLNAWTGSLYTIYMIGAYLVLSLFGWAILRSEIMPHWYGTLAVVWGYVLGIGFVSRTPLAKLAEIPALIHIPTLLFGIGLLR